jgi:hypothetical protein
MYCIVCVMVLFTKECDTTGWENVIVIILCEMTDFSADHDHSLWSSLPFMIQSKNHWHNCVIVGWEFLRLDVLIIMYFNTVFSHPSKKTTCYKFCSNWLKTIRQWTVPDIITVGESTFVNKPLGSLRFLWNAEVRIIPQCVHFLPDLPKFSGSRTVS